MIVTDVIRVTKHQKTPVFAINTKIYKDGGSKEYTGLGYKVIKYNQLQGLKKKLQMLDMFIFLKMGMQVHGIQLY